MMKQLSRRTFLRGTGVALGLPLLDAMTPAFASAPAVKRRMVFMCTTLGIHVPHLFPAKPGRDYEATPYLKILEEFRNDFTVFSGVSHPAVDGGHRAEASYLTAAPHPNSSSFRNTISVDQVAAELMGGETRFDSLVLGSRGGSLSWTRGGVSIPSERSPSKLFAKLFLDGSKTEVDAQVRKLKDGQSIMDTVNDEARKLEKELGRRDREKLDQYFTSVRKLEKRLVKAEDWAYKPKPKVEAKQPRDITDRGDTIGRARLMYDLVHLAIQTDSTRIITLHVGCANLVPPIEGVTIDHHNLSHHGKDPKKIAMLRIIEEEQMKAYRDLLARLKETKEEGGTLLDRTMVLYGSNLGNASSHNTKNMPILLAGGGFRHGLHLAFDTKNNEPLCNVFVSMLQQFGLEVDRFASSTGTMKGLVTNQRR